MESKTVVIYLKSYSELLDKIERYEDALEEIHSIAKFTRSDLVPKEVREIAWKTLNK